MVYQQKFARSFWYGLLCLPLLWLPGYAQLSLPDDFSGVALVRQKDEVRFYQAAGRAAPNGEQLITTSMRFRIGSLTKQFTAAAILRLQEQGKLKLTDPLARFRPDFPRAEQITIHHLLSHSSGLSDYQQSDYRELKNHAAAYQSALAHVAKRKPRFAPGAKFEYNNAGYLLLGIVIEAASGQSWAEYLHREFFAPLQMHDTGYAENNADISNLAAGMTSKGRSAETINYSLAWSAGGLYSTAEDLQGWVQALATGKVLSAASRQMMFTPQAGEYGYGWVISERFGRRVIWHNGQVTGYFSFLAHFPDDEVEIILLSNQEKPVGPVARALGESLFGQKRK